MKISLHTKIILKGVFHSVLQLLVAILFGWFNDCLLEMMISYACFFFFRTRFEKQFHAITNWGCTSFAIFDYFVRSIILPNKNISLIATILMAYSINLASYIYKDWRDKKDLENAKIGKEPKKGKDSKRQTIIEILGKNNLSEEKIEEFCVSIGCVNLSETIYLFLNNTVLDVSVILEIDRSTIFRRVDKFIEKARTRKI